MLEDNPYDAKIDTESPTNFLLVTVPQSVTKRDIQDRQHHVGKGSAREG